MRRNRGIREMVICEHNLPTSPASPAQENETFRQSARGTCCRLWLVPHSLHAHPSVPLPSENLSLSSHLRSVSLKRKKVNFPETREAGCCPSILSRTHASPPQQRRGQRASCGNEAL